MNGKVYLRKCLHCKLKFIPRSDTHTVCSIECSRHFAAKKIEEIKRKQQKEWNKEKKVRKEKLKSRTDHLNELQVIFNKYVRLRDKDKPCISCNRPLKGKYDCGHFFSVGAYPALRFHLSNNHGQCVHCNRDRHGNIPEYTINLPNRIGQEAYNELLASRNNELKLTLPEILELKNHYKQLIKEY